MITADRVLVIAPHPDDEVLGCGGTLALLAERGASVHVLVVFDGAAGDPLRKYEAASYVERRHAEARTGGARIGVSDYSFWDLPEGHLATEQDLDGGSERLARLVRELRPELILAPWDGDAHTDHQTVARAVRRMAERQEFAGQIWGYEVWTPLTPDRWIDVSSVWDAKLAALEEHKSQLAYQDLVANVTALARSHPGAPRESFARLEVSR